MTRVNTKLRRYLASSAIILLGMQGNALAQDTVIAGGLEEIIVTAEKRQQNLQDVPIAISAFSESFIEQARIESFNDLVARVPGFSFSSAFKTRTLPALRGASSSIDAPGGDPAVAIFVDEIYQGATGDFDPDLFDLERIEVLRGPQGTLFGRNVVGGAISIVTRKPGNDIYARAEAGIGNYNAITARGTFSGPIADNVFGQISFSSRKRDGTSFNRTTGKHVDTIEKDSVRARLRVLPHDDAEMIFGAEYTRDTSGGSARDFLGPQTSIPEAGGFTPDTNPRIVDQHRDGTMDREVFGLSAHLNWETDIGSFTSISAYRQNNTVLEGEDAIGAPIPTLTASYDNRLKQFSQELRLVSNQDDRFTWVAGLYYLHVDNSQSEGFDATFYADTIFGDIQQEAFGTLGLHRNVSFQDVKTNSYAAYAQGGYKLTDRLNLTVGGRYTHDRKSGIGSTTIELPNIFFGADSFATDFSKSWGAFTPKATIDYKINDNVMAYATVSKGFKSGGFVVQEDAITTATPFNPEKAWNYEAGVKARFLDDRLQINATAFHVDYSNLQVDFTLPSGVTIVTNAGAASVDGLELELQAAPFDGLQLWGNYSFLDSEYDDFAQFTGLEMALTPRHSFTIGASYRAELSDSSYLLFQGDYQYKKQHILEPRVPEEQPPFRSGFNEMINASMTLGMADGQWEFVLWGKNLAKETYVVYGQDLWPILYSGGDIGSLDPATFNSPRYNEPRTYGVSVRWKFN
jgi:iron complex outermembrane receptor protein